MNLLKEYPWKEYRIAGIFLMVFILLTQVLQKFISEQPLELGILFIQFIIGWGLLFILSVIILWIVNLRK